MMSYMNGSGGGSPPDLDKLDKLLNLDLDKLYKPLNLKLDLPKINFDDYILRDSCSTKMIMVENNFMKDLMFGSRGKKWVEEDEIEIKAIQENSKKTSYLFIMANLNCKENEISFPCLPQDLLKEILIIKTISETQDISDREATFSRRKFEEVFSPLFVEHKANDSWCQIQ